VEQRTTTHLETIHYVHHDNGIDEFILKVPCREAVDDWVRQLDPLIERTPSDGMIRQLIDLSLGMPSLSYTLQKLRSLLARHPDYRLQRLAILHTTSLIPQLVGALLPLLRLEHVLRVRYFKSDRRDEAIEWLLADN